MPAPYSVDLRTRVVGYSYRHGVLRAALLFHVGTATIKRRRALDRKTKSVRPKPMGGDRRSLARDPVARRVVEEAVHAKPDRTLIELMREVLDRAGVATSCSALHPCLQSLGFSLKKKVIIATEQGSDRVQALRTQYISAVAAIDPSRLVFIDESGVTTAMTRSMARSRRGHRVHGRTPRNRGNVTTLIGALALDGIRALMTIGGATTGDVFLAYVREFLVPTLRPQDVVVMDNAAVHKSAGVRRAIEAAGASVLFLPPYSPEFNPIEMTWSKLKSILRTLEARTRDELTTAVGTAMAMVTPDDRIGWFKEAVLRAQPD